MTRITFASTKLASVPGHKASPAKPMNPNAIKPVILGMPQDQSAATADMEAQQQNMVQQQKSLEEIGQARLSAQQAKQEAAIAKQQLALAKQQQQAASNTGTGDKSLVGRTMSRLRGRVNGLARNALTSRVSLLKAAADTRKVVNPNVKPFNSAGEWGAIAKQHKLDANGSAGGFMRGVAETIKNPLEADMDIKGDKWKPMSGNYVPGSIGSYAAPIVNAAVNLPRHSMQAVPDLGRTMIAGTSLPLQAIGKSWDVGRDWVNQIRQHGLNARLQDSPYLKEMGDLAKDSVWPVVGSIGATTPTGMASLLGFNTLNSLSQEETGQALLPWLGSKLFGGGSQPAQQEQQAQPGGAEGDPDIMQWLTGLAGQLGNYLSTSDLKQRLQQLLPSQTGAAGHIVRNPSAYY